MPADRITPTTWPDNAQPTVEKLADWLTTATRDELVDYVTWAREQGERGLRCFSQNHDWLMRWVRHQTYPSGSAPDDVAIWDEIAHERWRAHRKHGETSMESSPADDPAGRRLRILLEEVGEVAKEFNDAEHHNVAVDLPAVRDELIQVAAMAAAWADAIRSQVHR